MKFRVGVALVALVAAACSDRPTLDSFTMPPGQSPGGGLVTGELVGNEQCVQLIRPGELPVALLWEGTYTATFPPLRIYDAGGNLVASGGQTVWLGVEGNRTTSNQSCGTTKAFWVFSITTRDPVNDTP